MLLNCLLLFFIHLKLELLTQSLASDDEKIFIFMKNRHLQYLIIELTAETNFIKFSDISIDHLNHA